MEVTSTPSGMLPQAALSGVVPLDDGFMTRLLDAMHALQHGDYGVRLPSARTGLEGKVADAFNEMALRTERRVRDDENCSRQLLDAMGAFRNGDFSARMEATGTGIAGKLADAFNDIATVSERRAREAARVSHAVGKQGKLKQRMAVPGAVGGWADEVAAVNTLIDDRCGRRPRSPAPSAPSPRATSASRWASKLTAARSKASSSAPRSWSTA
jgi:hypothetical protein